MSLSGLSSSGPLPCPIQGLADSLKEQEKIKAEILEKMKKSASLAKLPPAQKPPEQVLSLEHPKESSPKTKPSAVKKAEATKGGAPKPKPSGDEASSIAAQEKESGEKKQEEGQGEAGGSKGQGREAGKTAASPPARKVDLTRSESWV